MISERVAWPGKRGETSGPRPFFPRRTCPGQRPLSLIPHTPSPTHRLSFSLAPSTPPALLFTARAASGGPINYFPGLSRRKTPTSSKNSAVHNNHLMPESGGRHRSLSEVDALAVRRWAFPRGSMSDPSHSRPSLAPGVHVVEGGPAVSTPGFHPIRFSVADPDWVASVPDHRAPA